MSKDIPRFQQEDILHKDTSAAASFVGALARHSCAVIVTREEHASLVNRLFDFARRTAQQPDASLWNMESNPSDPHNAIYVHRRSMDIYDMDCLEMERWRRKEGHVPGFREAIQEVYRRFSVITNAALRRVHLHYKTEHHTFPEPNSCGVGKHRWLSFLQYPKVDTPESILGFEQRNEGQSSRMPQAPPTVRVGAHIDKGTTITPPATQPGLERLLPNGTWGAVELEPWELLFMVGEQLQQYTSGRIRALQHRVAMPPKGREEESRYAILFSSF